MVGGSSEVSGEQRGEGDDFKNWQRKFLMHCVEIAKKHGTDEAIGSAERLEAAGEPLLYGLTDKARTVLAKAKAEGKL